MALAAALALAGCGSDDAPSTNNAAVQPATSVAPGTPPPYDAIKTVSLSKSEHDRLLGATFDATNRLYAAGWVADGPDQMMAVTRFNTDGTLDATFGTAGLATVNVAKGAKAVELARGVVVQASGKVVISGPVEHDPGATGDAAKDTDIALARFDTTGKLDTTFGAGGIVRLDLSTGIVDGTDYRADTAWGLVKATGDKLLVIGAQVGVGSGRTDTDFAVVRLNADGTKDTTFGTAGVATIGIGPGISENPRTAVELTDGRIVVTGYASVNGVVGVVLLRLTSAGALDTSFADSGIAFRPVLAHTTESYSIVQAGNRLVTTGYGKDTAEAKVDMVVSGFTMNGAIDPTFGTNGLTRVEIAGEDDRGRNLVALPDGRLIVVGSGKPTAANIEGMVVRLTANGALDPAYGQGGRKLIDVGGPNDSFFGVALSPDAKTVAVVGYLGRDTAGRDEDGSDKDDSAVLYLQP